jgi:two-component system, OmpR family, sensor kinase
LFGTLRPVRTRSTTKQLSRGLREFVSPRYWSLRRRLIVAVIVLTAAGLSVSTIVGTALLRDYLIRQVDQQLELGASSAQRIPSVVGQPVRPVRRRPPAGAQHGQLPTPFLITVLDEQGQVQNRLGGSLGLQGAGLPDLSGVTASQARAQGDRPFTVASRGGDASFRVRTVLLPDGRGIVAVAVSLSSVDATVARLERISWTVDAAILVGVLAIGIGAIGFGLRPLRAMGRTAERIAAGDLSSRVRPASTRTEVGRLADSINIMLAQIEAGFIEREANQATLRQFVADASHELRTPLTTVKGYAELARRGALVDDGGMVRAMVRIEDETTRMGRLVDDLLLLAYLDQRRPLDLHRVEMDNLVRTAIADARVRDQLRCIEYDGPDSPVVVIADPDRMGQVLGNLLGNALVHTPPDTTVRVTLSATSHTAQLIVSDNGPGLPPEQADRIFERFYRADPGRGRPGGAGLGLAIVAAIVHACGGTVACESTPGAGTAFRVELPLAEPAALHS